MLICLVRLELDFFPLFSRRMADWLSWYIIVESILSIKYYLLAPFLLNSILTTAIIYSIFEHTYSKIILISPWCVFSVHFQEMCLFSPPPYLSAFSLILGCHSCCSRSFCRRPYWLLCQFYLSLPLWVHAF